MKIINHITEKIIQYIFAIFVICLIIFGDHNVAVSMFIILFLINSQCMNT